MHVDWSIQEFILTALAGAYGLAILAVVIVTLAKSGRVKSHGEQKGR